MHDVVVLQPTSRCNRFVPTEWLLQVPRSRAALALKMAIATAA
jgi:hypothetical protein